MNVNLKSLGEQARNCINSCLTCFNDFSEENVPLFTGKERVRYYGNLTPPNERDRIDILRDEPAIIDIIDASIPPNCFNLYRNESINNSDVYYDAQSSMVASV